MESKLRMSCCCGAKTTLKSTVVVQVTFCEGKLQVTVEIFRQQQIRRCPGNITSGGDAAVSGIDLSGKLQQMEVRIKTAESSDLSRHRISTPEKFSNCNFSRNSVAVLLCNDLTLSIITQSARPSHINQIRVYIHIPD